MPGLPADCRFGPCDLDAGGAEERPAVSNCILHLRDVCCAQPAPSSYGPGAPVAAAAADGAPLTPPSGALRGSAGGAAGELGTGRFGSYMTNHLAATPSSYHRVAHTGSPAAHLTPAGSSYGAVTPAGIAAQQAAAMAQRSPPPLAQALLAAAASPSPLTDGHGALGAGGALPPHAAASHSHSALALRGTTPPFVAGAGASSSTVAVTHKSVEAAAGVTKLMQQCTTMLRQRMFPAEVAGGGRFGSPAGPDSAMKALGPVLEGVLGHLTEEYEKRLLAKDHALSTAADARSRAEREAAAARTQLEAARREADAAGAAAAREAAGAAEAEAATARREAAEALDAAATAQAELAAARAALDGAGASRAGELAALTVECAALRRELAGLQDVHERYSRVVEENRSLYNTVQDLRGNIRVFCRQAATTLFSTVLSSATFQ